MDVERRGWVGDATRASLLSRVRDGADAVAWGEFDQKYRELIVRFCRKRGIQQADADDVAQTVLSNLARALRGQSFSYDPAKGRFRDYLYRCTRNALSQRSARPGGGQVALDSGMEAAIAGDPRHSGSTDDDSPAERAVWEGEWVSHHYRLAMKGVRESFEARSVEIFDRSVAGETVASLAAAYGMSEQAVHKVRQRIKARMEELVAEQIRLEDLG